MRQGETGYINANQGERRAKVLAVKNGRALLAYQMPAGRVFYWDVPEYVTWSQLRADGFGRLVRNVSATKPPARWRQEVADHEGVA